MPPSCVCVLGKLTHVSMQKMYMASLYCFRYCIQVYTLGGDAPLSESPFMILGAILTISVAYSCSLIVFLQSPNENIQTIV